MLFRILFVYVALCTLSSSFRSQVLQFTLLLFYFKVGFSVIVFFFFLSRSLQILCTTADLLSEMPRFAEVFIQCVTQAEPLSNDHQRFNRGNFTSSMYSTVYKELIVTFSRNFKE